jgi:hypothetical protein
MKRSLIAIAAGVILTAFLTLAGLSQNSRGAFCVFVWQACLVKLVVHTPDNPAHEGSPIDLLGFFLGVLAGVPIYSLITYGVLTLRARINNGSNRE